MSTLSTLKLTPETPADRSLVATLIARTYLAVGADMIEMTGRLRGLPQHRDELGVLAANAQNQALGYALFTPVSVGTGKEEALLLAPLAYDTLHEGIDPNALLGAMLNYAKDKGYRYVLMHGDLEACRELGLKDAEEIGVTSAVHYPNTILLVKDFEPGTPATLSGAVHYPPFVK